MKSFEPREYRSPALSIGVCAIGSIMGPYSAWALYSKEGFSLLSTSAMFLAPLFVAGLADALTTKVVLTLDNISIRSNFRRRVYPRAAFSSVSWGKGVPVALQYREGNWLKLPGVNTSVQGLANTLRAWLARPLA